MEEKRHSIKFSHPVLLIGFLPKKIKGVEALWKVCENKRSQLTLKMMCYKSFCKIKIVCETSIAEFYLIINNRLKTGLWKIKETKLIRNSWKNITSAVYIPDIYRTCNIVLMKNAYFSFVNENMDHTRLVIDLKLILFSYVERIKYRYCCS